MVMFLQPVRNQAKRCCLGAQKHGERPIHGRSHPGCPPQSRAGGQNGHGYAYICIYAYIYIYIYVYV